MTLTHSQIDGMTPDQLNEAVAVHVMGWQKTAPPRPPPFTRQDYGLLDEHGKRLKAFNPDTDANDDAKVLEKIIHDAAGNQAGVDFAECMELWLDRLWETRSAQMNDMLFSHLPLFYHNGDYARAALHAVAEMGGSDG